MLKPLGSGYTVTNCADIDINDPKNALIIGEIVKEAKIIHSEIILTVMNIDSFLGDLIAIFFTYGTEGNFQIFEELIIEQFSFEKKIQILEKIMENHWERFGPSKDFKKEFFEQVRYVQNHRNAFAHGDMIVDFKNRTAHIYHKQKPYPLTPEFLKDFQSRISYLSWGYFSCQINLVNTLRK